MLIREAVNYSDRVKVTSDFEPGDIVVFMEQQDGRLGIIDESTETHLILRILTGILTFDENSSPTLNEALKRISKLPVVDQIEPGVFLSRIVEDSPGNYYRQYAEVLNVVKKNHTLKSVTLGYINGMKKDQAKTLEVGDWEDRWKNLAGWEIEQ